MSIELSATANADDIARSVADSWDMRRDNCRGLIDFITDIDDYVNDLDFTVALRDQLNLIIEAEAE
jgi:hypothetical protein